MRINCYEVLDSRAEIYVQLEVYWLYHRLLERQRSLIVYSPSTLRVIERVLDCWGLEHLHEDDKVFDNPFVLREAKLFPAYLRHLQLPRVYALGRVLRSERFHGILHDGRVNLQLPHSSAAAWDQSELWGYGPLFLSNDGLSYINRWLHFWQLQSDCDEGNHVDRLACPYDHRKCGLHELYHCCGQWLVFDIDGQEGLTELQTQGPSDYWEGKAVKIETGHSRCAG